MVPLRKTSVAKRASQLPPMARRSTWWHSPQRHWMHFQRESGPVVDPGPDPGSTSLKVNAKKTQKQKGKKIKVKLSVSAREKVKVKATGKVKTRKPNKTYNLKPQTRTLKAGKRKTFKLVPRSKKDAKKIAKAIREYSKAPRKKKQKLAVKVQVKVVATDAAGNKSAEKRLVGLK